MIEHKININTHFYKVSLLLTQSLNQNSLGCRSVCKQFFLLLCRFTRPSWNPLTWMDGKCLNSFPPTREISIKFLYWSDSCCCSCCWRRRLWENWICVFYCFSTRRLASVSVHPHTSNAHTAQDINFLSTSKTLSIAANYWENNCSLASVAVKVSWKFKVSETSQPYFLSVLSAVIIDNGNLWLQLIFIFAYISTLIGQRVIESSDLRWILDKSERNFSGKVKSVSKLKEWLIDCCV